VSRYVLATANPHKATEMRAVLGPLGIELVDRPDDAPEVDETELTLEGNALFKARALCRITKLAAIADDTGLFVDALEGRPGVFSARYAGDGATYEQNVTKLLDELDGVPEPRTARFCTVIAVAWPDGADISVRGVLEGVITQEPRGTSGFGYDPVFAPLSANGRTLAELTPEEKNALSHRARALHALVEELAYFF
jgi:XTP/dITP diphosphohydrolase